MDIDLSESKIIGIDTEFDWRTTYFPILSIVQISTLNHLYLIDCLKVDPKITLKKCIENVAKNKLATPSLAPRVCLVSDVICAKIAAPINQNHEIPNIARYT